MEVQFKNILMLRRVLRGYTQEQLCKELRKKYDERCTQGEISAYEKGERVPSLERAVLIAKLLKCKVEDFFGLAEDFKDVDLERFNVTKK